MIIEISYLVAGLIAGYFFGLILVWGILTFKIGHLVHRAGLHFHHSLLGLLALMLIPFYKDSFDKIMLIVGFSVGIIIQHTIKEGFIFITKD